MRFAIIHAHMIDARKSDAQELDIFKLLQDILLERHIREHDKLCALGTRSLLRIVLRRRVAVDHLKVGGQILLLQRLRLRLRDPQRLRDYQFHADPPFLETTRMFGCSLLPRIRYDVSIISYRFIEFIPYLHEFSANPCVSPLFFFTEKCYIQR